jgi:hypothetical protein
MRKPIAIITILLAVFFIWHIINLLKVDNKSVKVVNKSVKVDNDFEYKICIKDVYSRTNLIEEVKNGTVSVGGIIESRTLLEKCVKLHHRYGGNKAFTKNVTDIIRSLDGIELDARALIVEENAMTALEEAVEEAEAEAFFDENFDESD